METDCVSSEVGTEIFYILYSWTLCFKRLMQWDALEGKINSCTWLCRCICTFLSNAHASPLGWWRQLMGVLHCSRTVTSIAPDSWKLLITSELIDRIASIFWPFELSYFSGSTSSHWQACPFSTQRNGWIINVRSPLKCHGHVVITRDVTSSRNMPDLYSGVHCETQPWHWLSWRKSSRYSSVPQH
jgi:hypothetical protein